MTENTENDYNAELDKYIEQLKQCKYNIRRIRQNRIRQSFIKPRMVLLGKL